jgi:hypothetical protein
MKLKTVKDIILAVDEIGGRLEPAGKDIMTYLPADCPKALYAGIRKHKPALLAILHSKARLHLVKQIMSGEFDGADDLTLRKLSNDLQAVAPMQHHHAWNHLLENKSRNGVLHSRHERR